MTYAYEGEPEKKRRAGLGAKVLIFACSILAVLGAFWTVVWFIRSYVEQPRIAVRAPVSLASRESEPATPPPMREPTARQPIAPAAAAATPTPAPAPAPAAALPANPPAVQLAGPAPAPTAAAPAPAAAPPADPPATGPINDRWFPASPAPVPWPNDPPNNGTAPSALAPTSTPAPAARNEPPGADEPVEEVVASMEPAITGVVPKPRPKPPANSAVARLREAPLPRPRPDGSAPQSVWTAVPVADDRFPQAGQ